MSVRIDCEYLGDLRVRAVHGPSGAVLHTDAPVDNHGKGESFSPTDLAATALTACMATIMGIQARTLGVELKGMRLSVEKHMTAQPPRRIARLVLRIDMPAGVPADARPRLERAAAACPVHHSLHPEIVTEVTWNWA